MRYTRVDLKSKKNESLLFTGVIVLIFFAAFFLGTTIFNFFIKGSAAAQVGSKTNNISENTDVSTVSSNVVDTNFVLLQCGVFSVKNNAQRVYNSLSGLGFPIIIEESGKFKVYFGIYESGEENKDLETLKNNNISVSKISLNAKVNNLCDEEIVEASRAAIKILNKLNEKSVTSVNIAQMKSWLNQLKPIDEKESNYTLFQDLKQYIGSLPDSLTKEKAVEFETKIINIVKTIS